MTLPLDDPRLAQLVTDLVDRRVRAAIDGMARIRYGIVAAVDPVTSTASLYLGGSSAPSPGFVYPSRFPPAVGDRVRAVNRGADRYIEANLSGLTDRPWRYVPTISQTYDPWSGATTSVGSDSTVELTMLPADGSVRAVSGLIVMSSSVETANASIRVRNYTASDGRSQGGIVYAGTLRNASSFMVTTGGTNNRHIRYIWIVSGGSVLTFWLQVTGWWVDA